MHVHVHVYVSQGVSCMCMSADPRLIAVRRVNDNLLSLRYITHYLNLRDHLLERSAIFLAKAFIVYRVRGEPVEKRSDDPP